MAQKVSENEWIAAAIQGRRKSLGLRQSDLLTLLHEHGLTWSRSTLASIEAGTRTLSMVELLIVGAALQVTPYELLSGVRTAEIAGPGGNTYRTFELLAALTSFQLPDPESYPMEKQFPLATLRAASEDMSKDPALAAIAEDLSLPPSKVAAMIRKNGFMDAQAWVDELHSQYESLDGLTEQQLRAIRGRIIRSISETLEGQL